MTNVLLEVNDLQVRFHLSERTVETYMTGILAKLGFDSRAQIAAWAVQAGLA